MLASIKLGDQHGSGCDGNSYYYIRCLETCQLKGMCPGLRFLPTPANHNRCDLLYNFPCLSLTRALLLLDSNRWCSQIDQYLDAGAFALSHADCPDTPPLSIQWAKEYTDKKKEH